MPQLNSASDKTAGLASFAKNLGTAAGNFVGKHPRMAAGAGLAAGGSMVGSTMLARKLTETPQAAAATPSPTSSLPAVKPPAILQGAADRASKMWSDLVHEQPGNLQQSWDSLVNYAKANPKTSLAVLLGTLAGGTALAASRRDDEQTKTAGIFGAAAKAVKPVMNFLWRHPKSVGVPLVTAGAAEMARPGTLQQGFNAAKETIGPHLPFAQKPETGANDYLNQAGAAISEGWNDFKDYASENPGTTLGAGLGAAALGAWALRRRRQQAEAARQERMLQAMLAASQQQPQPEPAKQSILSALLTPSV